MNHVRALFHCDPIATDVEALRRLFGFMDSPNLQPRFNLARRPRMRARASARPAIRRGLEVGLIAV
jgi:hypothetical protein